MGDWFTSRSFKILVVLLLSVVVLLGVIVSSLPAAVEKALVLGGDYVLGEGTTSVGRVEFRDFEKVRFEKLALKNPPSFPDDPFLEIGPSMFFLSGGSIFSSEPARVEVALGAAEVLVDASVGAEGLKLNLLDVYRKVREQIPAKDQEKSAQSSEAGPSTRSCDAERFEAMRSRVEAMHSGLKRCGAVWRGAIGNARLARNARRSGGRVGVSAAALSSCRRTQAPPRPEPPRPPRHHHQRPTTPRTVGTP